MVKNSNSKPANHRQPWTPPQDNKLSQLARRGTDTDDIAKAMQRTEDAIRSRAHEINVSLDPPDKKK